MGDSELDGGLTSGPAVPTAPETAMAGEHEETGAESAASPIAEEQQETGAASAPSQTSVGQELSRLADEVASLHEVIEQHDSAERFSSSLSQLTDELAQSRRQEWRPLYLDMILLLDRVENGLSAWSEMPAVEEFVATVRDEIVEILARRGVTAMTAPDGRFDPKRQRAVKVSATHNPDDDRRVIAVVRRGYECDGYILRPEEVVVSRYSEATVRG